jgi:putative tricarboxylic transport membrane protein
MSIFATRLTGLVLFVFAVVWTVVAYRVIPEGFGGTAITPRTFPIGLGIVLALLSIGLVAGTFMRNEEGDEVIVGRGKGERASEIWAIAVTFGFLIIYMIALNFVGFFIATIAVLAAMLYFVLRSRSPFVVIGVPLGLAFGIWLVMGKFMGVYLPHGTLIYGI